MIDTLDFDQVVPIRSLRIAFGEQSQVSYDGGQCTLVLILLMVSAKCVFENSIESGREKGEEEEEEEEEATWQRNV